MDDNLKQMIADKRLATLKVKDWIGLRTKTEIASILNMARSTLYIRLEDNSWTFNELELINKHLLF